MGKPIACYTGTEEKKKGMCVMTMDAIYENDKQALTTFMENETICWGEVSRLARDPDGQSYMIVVLAKDQESGIKEGGEKCVIFASEADADNANPYLMALMGRRVPFVIQGMDEENNRLVCSRKRAQELLKTLSSTPKDRVIKVHLIKCNHIVT